MSELDGTVIDRFYAGLASGDLDAALACTTPDMRTWHCFDGIVQDREQCLVGWRSMVENLPERAFVDVRRHAIPGGFVQQHMMAAKTSAGTIMAWPVCMLIWLENGLIARIDEYIDRAGRFTMADLHAATTPGL